MGCALMTILILVVAGADWISLILHVPLDLSGQHVCVCGVVPGYDIQRAKPVRQKLYGNVYEIKRAQPVRHKLQDQTVRRIIYGNVYEVNCERNVMFGADQGNNTTFKHRQKSHKKNKGWNGTAKKRVRKWNSLNPSFLIEYHRMLRRARLRWWRFMIQRTPSSNFRARKSETQSVRPHSNPRDEEAEDKIYRLPPPGNTTPLQSRITDYFNRLRIEERAESAQQVHNSDNETRNIHIHIENDEILEQPKPQQLKILQWNACSLNGEKRAQLELLLKKEDIDLVCISELGRYRQVTGYPNYVKATFVRRVPYFGDMDY